MKIIISFFIIVFSIITAGIFYWTGLVELSTVSFKLWVPFFIAVYYGLYKIRFKNRRVFKFFLLRQWIKFNRYFQKLDNKVVHGNSDEMQPIQKKALKLWTLLLKDSDSVLHYSADSGERQLKTSTTLIILSEFKQDYNIVMFDKSSAGFNFYETKIFSQYIQLFSKPFDMEMNKRMIDSEQKWRKIVEDSLEDVFKEKEEIIKKKST